MLLCDMTPPESKLVEHYQVSRTAVRQVLDMLVNEGLIHRYCYGVLE